MEFNLNLIFVVGDSFQSNSFQFKYIVYLVHNCFNRRFPGLNICSFSVRILPLVDHISSCGKVTAGSKNETDSSNEILP